MGNKILYYPYIELPDESWTVNSILYWDEIGTIYPDIVDKYYAEVDELTRELLEAKLLTPVKPSNFDYDRNKLITSISQIISNPKFELDGKRTKFKDGFYIDCFTEKFEEEVFKFLTYQKLASKQNNDKYCVEHHTANIVILLLATEIGNLGGYTPSTDSEHYIDKDFFSTINQLENYSVRNEILSQILPSPKEFYLKDLVKFKDKHRDDLVSFRNEIELVVDGLSLIENLENREEIKRKKIISLKEHIDFIIAKMRESKLEKIQNASWISTIVSLVTTITTLNPVPLLTGTISAVMSSGKALITDHSKGSPYRYVGLIEKEFNK